MGYEIDFLPVGDKSGDAIALRYGNLFGQRTEQTVVVVDGGSEDDTAAVARRYADRVLRAPRGRALQMNAGAAVAHGEVRPDHHTSVSTEKIPFADLPVPPSLFE